MINLSFLAHLRKPRRRSGLRNRIIVNSVVILLVLVIATSYTAFASFDLARSVELLFRNSISMEELRSTLRDTQGNLTGYLSAKNSESLKEFIRTSTILSGMTSRLNRENKVDDVFLLEKDLAFLLDSYLASAEGAVQAQRGRDVAQYVSLYEDARRNASLIEFLSARMDTIIWTSRSRDFLPTRRISACAGLQRCAVARCLFAFDRPHRAILVHNYRASGTSFRCCRGYRGGEYDHPLPPYEREDEIRTLHDAFVNMQDSIQRAFAELTRKAELERSFMEERMRVLTYQHRLKDAELLALQTQINPHFLYNTLAAGWQLALTEGNEKTAEFLEKLAAFIRYALKPSTRFVLVSEEIECVRQYIWLLKLRFGERFRFRLEAQDEALGYETPALVLHPLVENAIVHGLKDLEEGGDVIVSARLDARRSGSR